LRDDAHETTSLGSRRFTGKDHTIACPLSFPSGTKHGTKPLLFSHQKWLYPYHFRIRREDRELDSNLYGAFPVKWLFLVLLPVLCSEREGRSSSRRLRSGSRSARKGSRDRNASIAWRLCRLASLVFRSALTPEHAER
jgi:hypothetical protein